MRYAVLIAGPAGSGKTTFSKSFITHLAASRRSAHLVNLDPANASFDSDILPVIDIRDLISLGDVMSELQYGPNGALVYCFE
jgi:GTPase SAR1 family protein